MQSTSKSSISAANDTFMFWSRPATNAAHGGAVDDAAASFCSATTNGTRRRSTNWLGAVPASFSINGWVSEKGWLAGSVHQSVDVSCSMSPVAQKLLVYSSIVRHIENRHVEGSQSLSNTDGVDMK